MMLDKTKKSIGLTKDTGYQFGLRQTFDINLKQAWQFLTSSEGIRIWLGEVKDFHLEKGHTYQAADGTTGEVRIVNPEVNLRLTWQPKTWQKASTIQIRVIPAGEKTAISFHQENLPDVQTREQMRQRWEMVMAQIPFAVTH